MHDWAADRVAQHTADPSLTPKSVCFRFNPDHGDQCLAGLNFVTLRARRDILMDYKTVLLAVYEPSAYFSRVRAVGRALRRPKLPLKFNAKMALRDVNRLLRLMWRMTVRCPTLRRHFWETLAGTARHNPRALKSTISLMVLYLHLGAFSQQLVRDLDKQIAAPSRIGSRTSCPLGSRD